MTEKKIYDIAESDSLNSIWVFKFMSKTFSFYILTFYVPYRGGGGQ